MRNKPVPRRLVTIASVLALTISVVLAVSAVLSPSRPVPVDAAGFPTIDGLFSGTGPIPAGGSVDLQITGRGGVPGNGVGSVALNVTVTGPTAASYLTAYPAGSARPNAANLVFTKDQTIPNMVIVPIGTNGRISLFNFAGRTDVVVDVQGWFPAGNAITGINPARLLDTRPGYTTIDHQAEATGPVGTGDTRHLIVAGRAGIPATASAVALNVTVTNPTSSSFLTVHPTGVSRPNAANLNFTPNLTISNMVIAKIGSGGQIDLYNLTGSTDVVVDALGWFPAASGYTGVTPARVLDTRAGFSTIDGQAAGTGPLGAGATRHLQLTGRAGVPSNATAVALNVTVTNPTAASFLTVHPTGVSRPNAANLNFTPGQTIPNMVIAKLGTGGQIDLYNLTGTVDITVDVQGWFTDTTTYSGLTPARVMDTRDDGQPIPTSTNEATCRLVSPAFCETFSSGPAAAGGRTGELDPTRWSVARAVGDNSATNQMTFPNTPMTACQTGITTATADHDIHICDQSSGHTGQALTSMSAQNYGLLSMRPRQPFDFNGRTGTITLNVDAVTQGILSWWTSVFLTDEPTPLATNATQVLGYLPRNGLGINFDDPCTTNNATKMRVSQIYTYHDNIETIIPNTLNTCITTQRGALNHIEIHISQTNLEIWATNPSTDGGHTYPALQKIFTAPINLTITRGFIHYQQAERAPIKYATLFNITPGYTNTYWSGLGFDGPTITPTHDYPLTDNLTPNPNGGLNIGYPTPTTGLTLTTPPLDLTNTTTTELTLATSYTYFSTATPTTIGLRYQINGGPIHTPDNTPNYTAQQTCTGCPGPTGGGGINYHFTIPTNELHNGTNTITLTSTNTIDSWPAITTSIDLITH
jgi:hypothetical protein